MRHVFIYEFVTGGGFLRDESLPLPASLLAEGRAMLTTLAADFMAIPDRQVTVLRDHRVPVELAGANIVTVRSAADERPAFDGCVADADAVVVIAPEFDDLLRQRAAWVVEGGGRLLSPDPRFIALAADKQQTALRLAATGVPATDGVAPDKGDLLPGDFGYPAVLKPRFGAGSESISLIDDAQQASSFGTIPFAARLERYVPGTAASVSLLCGPSGVYALPACRQRLSDDGRFTYLGGSLPMGRDWDRRARNLAKSAVAALGKTVGLVGVDIVLGEHASEDVVVEVNPRMTTSYVGLRAACAQNLATAMLNVAAGHETELSFSDHPIEFDANGLVAGQAQP